MGLIAVSQIRMAVVGVSALVFSAQLFAQSRPEVLERIAPVGQVAIDAQATAAPSAPPVAQTETAPPPAETAPAPATAAAPAVAAPAAAAATSAPAAATTASGDGAQLFVAKTCAACHGADANTPIMPTYPRLAGQNAAYLEQQLKDIKSGARTHGQTMLMKGIMAGVSDEEIKAIADWISQQ